jgi:hypothetical protein
VDTDPPDMRDASSILTPDEILGFRIVTRILEGTNYKTVPKHLWEKYRRNAHDALNVLDEHGLDQDVRYGPLDRAIGYSPAK